MARPSQDLEEEYRPTDPAAAAQEPSHDEPLDVDGSEKEYIGIQPSTSGSASDEKDGEKEKKPAFDRSRSYATTASALTTTESHVSRPPQKRPWHKKLNPLKWGGVPPVPETRKVSREYGASFFSKVYFQWVAPIMSVCWTSTSFGTIHQCYFLHYRDTLQVGVKTT